MKALNYPAAAARGLARFIAKGKASPHAAAFATDIRQCERFLELLLMPECQHFQLPEGGRIFDDQLKGIQGKPARLPYGLVSISYRCDNNRDYGDTFDGSKLIHVPKRVVLAIEIPAHEVAENYAHLFPGCERLCMVMAILCQQGEEWRPCIGCAILPMDQWDGTGYEGDIDRPPTFMKEPDGHAFMGKIRIMLPTHYDQLKRTHGADYAARSLYYDIGGEAAVVLELCEALTCSNVKEHIIQRANPRLNARRAREGHLPFLETKILTVVVPKQKGAAPYRGGTHDSPGFHLCSGHIRGWPNDPTRNIWIEDYARGDRAKGEVKKTYKVVAA
jgi:hypothetical protein